MMLSSNSFILRKYNKSFVPQNSKTSTHQHDLTRFPLRKFLLGQTSKMTPNYIVWILSSHKFLYQFFPSSLRIINLAFPSIFGNGLQPNCSFYFLFLWKRDVNKTQSKEILDPPISYCCVRYLSLAILWIYSWAKVSNSTESSLCLTLHAPSKKFIAHNLQEHGECYKIARRWKLILVAHKLA
jgi:hypothetical protein